MLTLLLVEKGLSVLKTATDIATKLKGMKINFRVDHVITSHNTVIANVLVTSKTPGAINLEAIELHINDQVYHQVPINEIVAIDDEEFKIVSDFRTVIASRAKFKHLLKFPFSPFLQENELAQGIVFIPLSDAIGDITTLLLRIPIAGETEPFEYELNA